MLSSPQEQPFVCMTERFKLASGGTLGRPLDANCSIATRVDYVYRATGTTDFKPLTDTKAVPAERHDGHRERPAGARTSSGSRPARSTAPSTRSRCCTTRRRIRRPTSPRAPPAGTAGSFTRSAAAASPGWYQQGASTGGVMDDGHLRQGYAVASASLDVAGNNCNDVISAETMMMVKERFIEAYGVPPSRSAGARRAAPSSRTRSRTTTRACSTA